ncbi:DUF3817 domain-containing protein [Xanthomonadaceae bacterium JHOS43]|nr:DUF3817 domain-containing protein [Xanthomonadaceae bacterium JHOS43]
MSVRQISPMGRVFSIVAMIEAITWAGLLIGMWLKYGAGVTDAGVWWFGRLHGAAFLVYLVVSILVAWRLNWPFWATLLAIGAAIPPLVTLPLEIWFRRRGLLSTSISRQAVV